MSGIFVPCTCTCIAPVTCNHSPQYFRLLDINKAFYDKQGIVVEGYYGDDLIHMSASGVKRLLGEVDKQINIVENFGICVFKSRYQKKERQHTTDNDHNSSP